MPPNTARHRRASLTLMLALVSIRLACVHDVVHAAGTLPSASITATRMCMASARSLSSTVQTSETSGTCRR